MFKNQKGITLIALVITIIVLLILAGVTIAMLTGSDSAPAKANEAKQKQDIGAAKDQVYIYVSDLQTQAYETAYVDGKTPGATSQAVTKAGASNSIGNWVGPQLAGKTFAKVGDATIVVKTDKDSFSDPSYTASVTSGTTAKAYVQIYTTDFKVEGWIAQAGGVLEWNTAGIVNK